MPQITITLEITDEQVTLFDDCKFLVVPLHDAEMVELAKALAGIHDALRFNRKALVTLNDLLESKDATPKQIAETLAKLAEPNIGALTLIDTVRTYLGRATAVGQTKDRGSIQ